MDMYLERSVGHIQPGAAASGRFIGASLPCAIAGDVVAVGSGDTVTLKTGDSVVYSKFGIGVTEIQMQGEDYCIIKENDIIGVMPRFGAVIMAVDVSHVHIML